MQQRGSLRQPAGRDVAILQPFGSVDGGVTGVVLPIDGGRGNWTRTRSWRDSEPEGEVVVAVQVVKCKGNLNLLISKLLALITKWI